MFQGLGDENYSGDFDCEPSDSIQAEADPIPYISQFLSPDQTSRIEQPWTYDQDQLQSSAEGIQIANIDGFLPTSEGVDSFQPLDPGLSGIFDDSGSGSQAEFDVFPDTTDYLIDGQNIPSGEGLGGSLFLDTDLIASSDWGEISKL